jgi:hypothetical protein
VYDEDVSHNMTNAALTAGAIGLTTWMSWIIGGIVIVLLMVLLYLRARARRNEP